MILYFNEVPGSITLFTFIFIFFLDWVAIEGVIQYAKQSTGKAYFLNGFRNNLCWYEIIWDVAVGAG